MLGSPLDVLVARYQGMATFADLDVAILRSMARVTETVNYPRHHVIFREGDPADALYIVDKGEVEVIKGAPSMRLALLGPDHIFGEMGLMEMRGRSATILAHTDVRLFRLEGQRIEVILKRTPALLYRLVNHLSARLRHTDQQMIRDLTDKTFALETAYRDLQNAQAALIDKARLDRELALAQELQRAILPMAFPLVPGFDIVARGQPAREVGGDFYDLIALDDQHIGVVMADVSDKGVYAGMFMTMCHALIHAEARRNLSPASVLQAVHRLISGLPMTRMFVTVVYAVINRVTHTLTYARAGHEPPLLVRPDGTCIELDAPGSLISASLPLVISEAQVALQPHDLVLFYTDGVTEATAPSRARYGSARLESFTRSHANLTPNEFCSALLSDLMAFTATAPQHDDIAMLAIRIND